jgi:hypothetical protein
VFRAADLNAARNVIGGFFGLGHSSIVSFSPLAAVTLILLAIIVWFMPGSLQIVWRFKPALKSPYGDDMPATKLAWAPTRLNAALYGLLCIIAVMALSNLKPFIYFQF